MGGGAAADCAGAGDVTWGARGCNCFHTSTAAMMIATSRTSGQRRGRGDPARVPAEPIGRLRPGLPSDGSIRSMLSPRVTRQAFASAETALRAATTSFDPRRIHRFARTRLRKNRLRESTNCAEKPTGGEQRVSGGRACGRAPGSNGSRFRASVPSSPAGCTCWSRGIPRCRRHRLPAPQPVRARTCAALPRPGR
jgi:hypothetical protein